MRVIGIDPGYAIVGYGVLEYEKGKFYPVEYGAVTTDAHTDFQMRIKEIFLEVDRIIKRTRPEALAIEKLFYTTNQKTVMQVAQARGVILLAASLNDLPVYEYTPLQVKQSVTGYGKAVKKQVQEMTKNILRLDSIPKPDDTADALAMAICHGYSYKSKLFTQIGTTK
ncbi:MAG: crossover junction endodeoxyribonuclease RuvC [Oscillospiraceae bacterium]|nr:crossover junction endodeoxyribonuclease RuvC [Oscillospiraceae bacterium]